MIIVIRKINGYAEMGYALSAELKVASSHEEIEELAKQELEFIGEYINVYSPDGKALYSLTLDRNKKIIKKNEVYEG